MSTTRIDDGGAAFPRPASIDPTNGTLPDGDRVRDEQDGMTLRDWFAGKALQGLLAYSHVNPQFGNYHENCTPEQAARAAYGYADWMIAARNTKPTEGK